MKRLLAILLILAMLLSLAACGGSAEEDPNAGKYIGIRAAVGGFSMPMSDIYSGETWIELKSGGKGTITLDGDSFSLKWALEGESITITLEGVDSVGTLKNGAIVMDLMNMGCVMTFQKEGAAVEENADGALKNDLKDKLNNNTAAPQEHSELGLYYGTTYEYNEQVFNMTDIYNSLCSLELLEDGKCVFILGEETIDCTWRLDGEEFVLTTNQFVESPGTLANGVITIDFMGMGMVMTFEKNSNATPAAPVETPVEAPVETPSETPVVIPATEPAVSGAGILDYETIAEVYDWVLDYSSAANGYGKISYEEIVERMGGVEGAETCLDLWSETTRFYKWGISEDEYIQLTFSLKNGVWVKSGATNTSVFMDIYKKYYR